MLIKTKGLKILTNPKRLIVSDIFKKAKDNIFTGYKIKKIPHYSQDFVILITIVPKKVCKSAVKRNYYKRFIRNEFIKQIDGNSKGAAFITIVTNINEFKDNKDNIKFI